MAVDNWLLILREAKGKWIQRIKAIEGKSTLSTSVDGHQRGNKGDGIRSKEDSDQIQIEHLWKVKTAEVARNLRARPRPHIPTVIVDRLRLWIKVVLPRMCTLSFVTGKYQEEKTAVTPRWPCHLHARDHDHARCVAASPFIKHFYPKFFSICLVGTFGGSSPQEIL